MTLPEFQAHERRFRQVDLRAETVYNAGMTFELVDLEELGEKALQDFNEVVTRTPPGRSAELEQALAGLLAKVEFAYGVAARLAQRERTLEGTAAIWAKMVAICDESAAQVKPLEAQRPESKASLDRVLDYRNAAEKRRQLHS